MLNDCATKNVRSSFWGCAFKRLTFDSELLLDVLEVVGILGADCAGGSLDRHLGVIVLSICWERILLVARHEHWRHFAGGGDLENDADRVSPGLTSAATAWKGLEAASHLRAFAVHTFHTSQDHSYCTTHTTIRELFIATVVQVEVHTTFRLWTIPTSGRSLDLSQAPSESCLLLSQLIDCDVDQKHTILCCVVQMAFEVAPNPERTHSGML